MLLTNKMLPSPWHIVTIVLNFTTSNIVRRTEIQMIDPGEGNVITTMVAKTGVKPITALYLALSGCSLYLSIVGAITNRGST